ncbi:hypothetical protein DV737_g159, partial [Chaetothyriales sp. CBS 132003]
MDDTSSSSQAAVPHGQRGSDGARLKEARSALDLLQLEDVFDEELLDAGLEQYQQCLDELEEAKTHLDGLLASTADTLNQLSAISAAFTAIDGQTKAFQQQTAHVLEEQKKKAANAAAIAANLQYYEPLERISRRLNAPGAGSLARSRDFSDMLATLDQCIDYMQTHASHKEAEAYGSRYRVLLTRALTLVRNAFMASVRETTAEVAGRIAAKQLNDTTQSALLYAKFRVNAADMKDLGLEIQKRAMPSADAAPGDEGEYQSLMNELHAGFALSRARLILPLIQKRVAGIAEAPSSKGLVQFAKESIGYVRGVCLDEFELWGEWFHGQRGVYDFLESLCEPLYDYLRPRIVHESRLSKLCSLVVLIQTRYLPDDDDGSPHDPSQLDFSLLVRPALEDAQTRLLFRAQAVVRDGIEHYKATAADLDWPRKPSQPALAAPLSGSRKSKDALTPKAARVLDDEDSDTDGLSWSLASRNSAVLASSYPTLAVAIRLLSRIYRLINSSVFDDLAHAIVHSTTVSLHTAASLLTAKTSVPDGQLFLLRHLLLLKAQIVAFDIEYVSPDIQFDFTSLTSTFYELRTRGNLFNPSAWLRLLSSGALLPKVVENMLDAKVELDGRLRDVINDFTAHFAAAMTEPLPAHGDGGKRSKTKPEAAVGATRKRIEKEVPVLRAKLEQYLDDDRTRETLVAAVEDHVLQQYEAFFDHYIKATGKGKTVSKKGKSPETEVWDADTFAEWCAGVFAVQLPVDDVNGETMDGDAGNDDGDDNVSMSVSRSGSV